MRQFIILLICFSLVFLSCEIQEPPAVDNSNNTLADSDGDGWTDEEEMEYFNPVSNPYLFNPKIADYPQLEMLLDSVPAIGFYRTNGSSLDVSRGTETGKVTTMGSSYSSSQSTEITVSEEASFGLDSLGLSHKVEVSKGYEKTNAWSSEQAVENRSTAEVVRGSYSEYTGGSLAVSIKLKNNGNLDLILKSLQLSLMITDPSNRQLFIPFGNLQLESGFSSESEIQIPPKSVAGEGSLKYSSDLSLDDTLYLAEDSSGLIIDIAGANVSTVKDSTVMAYQRSTIFAATATLIIDYGNDLNTGDIRRPREEYRVAADKKGSTLKEILDDILYMDQVYKVGFENGKKGFTQIRGVSNDSSINGRWYVLQKFNLFGESNQIIFDINKSSYDPSSIVIYPGPGNEIELIYISDTDDDGLFDNQEYLLGADNLLVDSDNDGMDDSSEYFTRWVVYVSGWEPYIVHRAPNAVDYDKDGLDDNQEKDAGTDPYEADTDGDGISDYREIQAPTTDPLDPSDY